MGKSYGETDALAFRNQTATDVGHTRHWQSPEQPSSGARGQRSRQKHLLGTKMFPALDGPAGGPDTTFVKVPPGLGLLPLAPAPSSLRLTHKTVVGEATGRRTETEDEERVGHLAPRGAGGPPSSGGRDLPGPPAEGPSSSGRGGGGGGGSALNTPGRSCLFPRCLYLKGHEKVTFVPKVQRHVAATTCLRVSKRNGNSSA